MTAPMTPARIAEARAQIKNPLTKEEYMTLVHRVLPDALDALEEAMGLLQRVGNEPLLDNGLWDDIKAFLTKHGVQK